jgi:translation elongation factor EF-Tu-like GTPase
MSGELEKMSTVSKNDTGVEIRVRGEVKKQKIEAMIGSCATGAHACCGPEFFAKVDSIDVAGTDGDVAIRINGAGVTEEMIRGNLAVCDCYKP